MKKIILASRSVDRREILERAKIPFDIIEANIDEDKIKSKIKNPIELIKELAKFKALYVKNQVKDVNAIIIAADTIVEFNGEIIGKAKNEAEAFQMLKKLQNNNHNLLTGLAISDTISHKLVIDYECTMVQLTQLSDNEVLSYLKSGEWKGRAGAYSIRDKASLFIKKIEGSFSNVVGLPLFKIFEILKNQFNFNLFEI